MHSSPTNPLIRSPHLIEAVSEIPLPIDESFNGLSSNSPSLDQAWLVQGFSEYLDARMLYSVGGTFDSLAN